MYIHNHFVYKDLFIKSLILKNEQHVAGALKSTVSKYCFMLFIFFLLFFKINNTYRICLLFSSRKRSLTYSQSSISPAIYIFLLSPLARISEIKFTISSIALHLHDALVAKNHSLYWF